MTVVQDPDSAQWPYMPRNAVKTARPKLVLPLEQIAGFVQELCTKK
jgi:chemotaxis response regulator CheB